MRAGQARALWLLGEVRYLTNDYAGAASDLDEALAIFQELGNTQGECAMPKPAHSR